MGYTLSQIVEELLIELGEGQSNKFPRFYQLGLSFLRQKHFTTTGVPKVAVLELNDNDTADLPNDYVRYTKIGISINGQIISLGLDNNMGLTNSYDDCGNVIAPSASDGLAYEIYQTTMDRAGDHYRNGEAMGRFFGAGGDNNCLGYYKIDKESHQIRFSALAQRVGIVLEYLADVNVVDQDFEVHPFCIEALKDYMFWKYKLRSNKPLGETDMAHDVYKKSFNLMQRMFRSNTADEWIAAFASGNQATPKM
jgi:hypothetical protein